jgi:hypothetical protein
VFLTEIEELSQGAYHVTEELGYRVKNPLHASQLVQIDPSVVEDDHMISSTNDSGQEGLVGSGGGGVSE